MQIYDLSMPISELMPVYKNREEKRPILEVICNQKGKLYESKLSLPLHTGTHLDSPRHLFPQGPDISDFPLSQMIAPCQVLELSHVKNAIGKEHLAEHNIQEKTLLLKTRNSNVQGFDPNFVYLSAAGAAFLVEEGIICVGIDSLGIERNQQYHATHKLLFEHNVWVLEGLRLKMVPEGTYLLVAAPLMLPEGEASPVRALLVDFPRI